MKSVFMLSVCFSLLFMHSFFLSFQNRQVKKQRAQQLKVSQRPVRNQVFTETFESPRPFSTVSNTDFGRPYSIRIVDNPVFKGTRSARFELRDTDPMVNNGTRSEVTIIKSGVEREMWYSFAVYFPAEDFAPDSKTEIISQWWQAGDKHLGESNASPATALRIQNDRFIFDTGYNDAQVSTGVIPESRKKIDLGPVTKDSWHQFVFHFIHSYEPDGLIEIWHDDKKVLTHSCITTWPCRNGSWGSINGNGTAKAPPIPASV
jgi:hypothetical protein